jgi:DNA polymerase III delta subunit
MINYQIRNLLALKDLEERGLSYKEIMKKSKMKSFVFKKAYSQSKRLSFPQIKKIHQTLFEVDLNSKLGKIKPESGLMLIISQF